VAGDVYAEAPYVGRGGWSWYTGSAAWLHRAAIESMFGMRQRRDAISFEPCLPSHWPSAELTLRRDGRTVHVHFVRQGAPEGAAAIAHGEARALRVGEALRWTELETQNTFVLVLPLPGESAARAQASAMAAR
jgi:cyclic beta-1,2-glucan synthetase